MTGMAFSMGSYTDSSHTPPRLKPLFSLVFYEQRDHRGEPLLDITRHPIRPRKGGVYLGPGHAFTHGDLDTLIGILKQQSGQVSRTLIPENVLLHGSNELVWCVPGKVRPMWFKLQDKPVRLNVPWPTLLFHVLDGNLSVVALRDAKRPTETTPVYHAPLMNIYHHGGVCTGSADLPEGCDYEDRSGWEDVIFKTLFTHTNMDHTLKLKGKQTISNTVHLRFWRDLSRKKASRFPVSSLVPMHTTVGAFLTGSES